MKEALSCFRGVARECDDAEGRQIPVELVEGKQALYKREGHAWAQGRVLITNLMISEGLVASFLEKRVLFLKVEEGS